MSWADDPSNDNLDFERVRVRQAMGALTAQALEGLRATQISSAQRRADLSCRAAKLIDACVTQISPGLLLVQRRLAQEPDIEAGAEALRICLAFAGGSERMIDHVTASAILARLVAGESFRMTGARALADLRRQGLFLLRERRDFTRGMPVFDGRYIVSEDARRGAAPGSQADAPASLAAQALSLEPPAGVRIIRRILSPWPLRVPSFDLAAASALARLAGEPPLPAPPCSL